MYLNMLQIFYDATQYFSRGTPNLATVIPAMDRIDEHLATVSTDHTYAPSIRAGVTLGKKTMNRYYDKTDHSESYRIAMGTYNISLSLLTILYS